MKFLNLIQVITSILIIKSKIIQLSYEEMSNSYDVKLTISSKLKYFAIELAQGFSFISSGYYKKGAETIIVEKGTRNFFSYPDISYELLSDIVEFGNPNVVLSDFFFYYFLPEQQPLPFDSISLNFKHNKSFSVIENLYSKQIIDERTFSLVYFKENRGFLFLGGIPSTHTVDKYSGSCTVDSRYESWGCQIKKVLSNKKEYTINNGYFYLQSTQWGMSVPKNFLTFLNETYLSQYFEKGNCWFHEVIDIDNYHNIETVCKCFVFTNAPNFTFFIGNLKLNVDPTILFQYMSDNCRFVVKENLNDDSFILGMSFMRQFPILFDYDNQKLTFYSHNQINYINLGNFSSKTLILLNCILLSISLLFWIFVKIRKFYNL